MTAKAENAKTLSGPEKAIVLLALAGEECASALVEKLEEKELLLLRRGAQALAQVAPEHIEQVFAELTQQIGKAGVLPEGAAAYLQRVLTRALGEEKAAPILKRIAGQAPGGGGIEGLRALDGKSLAGFLENEHPQTIAFVLAHLEPRQAGEALGSLPEEKQAEVAYRIARLGRTSPALAAEVGDLLQRELGAGAGFGGAREVGGARPVAEMLSMVDRATEERLLAKLSEVDPEIAEKVRKHMLSFEDLGKIDDRAMQVLGREVPKEKWVLALRTASEEFKAKVFKNMSERAAALLKEEMEASGPVRLREVEAAQKEIVEIARRLEAEGQILLAAGEGQEDVLV